MSQIVTALREVIAERERLQAELAAMRETADATVAANINLVNERDLARQQVDELMAEREVAAQATKKRVAAIDALQAQATALEATVAEKDGQNTELRDLIAKSNQQVAVLQLERDTLQSEVTGLRVELKDAQALAETIRQESRAEIKAVEDKAKAELEATVATALDDMEKAQTVEKDLKAELLALTADREQTLTFLRTVQDDVLAKASEIEALKQEVTEAAVMAANAARSNEEAQAALAELTAEYAEARIIAVNSENNNIEAQKVLNVAIKDLKNQLQSMQDKHDNAVAAWGNDTKQLTEQLQTAKANYEGWMLQKEQSIKQMQNTIALLRGEQGQLAELLGVQIGALAQ
jgi:chromosome segregation ATPase